MPKIRGHKIFEVEYVIVSYNKGSQDIYKKDFIVAPSKEIAQAWVQSKLGFKKLLKVQENDIAAFIQEHVW